MIKSSIRSTCVLVANLNCNHYSTEGTYLMSVNIFFYHFYHESHIAQALRLDSRLQRVRFQISQVNISWFRIPRANISWISESGLPAYMGRHNLFCRNQSLSAMPCWWGPKKPKKLFIVANIQLTIILVYLMGNACCQSGI